MQRVVALARARGIFAVIDGAHGPGQIALDLNTLGADAYAGNGHTWKMAPRFISHGWQVTQTGAGAFGGAAIGDRSQMLGMRDP